MLCEMKEANVDEILQYLRKDIENCIYLYIDIYRYGVNNPYMKVWYEKKNDELSMVVMKYHHSFQIYSHLQSPQLDEVWKLMQQYQAAMISGREEIIRKLELLCEGEYFSTFGEILRLTNFYSFGCEDIIIEEATVDDALEIAQLICADDYYKEAYTIDELYEQLTDRMNTKMGRSFIIRDQGKVVAHNSISAETDDVAVAAMLLVDKKYRHTMYGIALEEFIVKKLNAEGKKLFGFSTNKKRKKQFERMGNKVAATYGKLIKK